MQQAPAISRSTFGRTLVIAGWVLGLAALAEIVAASIAMVERARHNPAFSQVPSAGLLTEAAPSAGPQPAFTDPFAGAANHAAAATPAGPTPALTTVPALPLTPPATPPPVAASSITAPALPKPTPVPASQIVTPESRVDALIAEARALRAQGDTNTAVTRLREGLALSPKNTLVIAELAGTYEKMGMQKEAQEQWRAIYDMGESAGIYYELADAKLKAADMVQPSPSASADQNNGVPLADKNGFQPGSSLALVNLSTVERPETSEGYKRFTLKIPVKRRPDAKINVAGVVIQVFFYDQLGNSNIVRTNANVSSHWATLPADWVQDDIEVLEVDYTQAPPEAGAIEEGRHYYGYVVCVYYNNDLQDQAADPDSLIKTFPPPLTLPEK